jgi:hypothetical protein
MQRTEIEIAYEGWQAIHDHMGKNLRVYGECVVSGGGVALTLEPSTAQGINPRMLMLDFRLTPTGESPSRQTVEFKQPWSNEGVQYNEVGFILVGPIAAVEPPSPLPIDDVY